MIEHLAAMLVSAIAFFGAILLYGAFSPRRLGGWKFWICFAAYCVLMEGAGPLANGLYSVCGVIGNNVGQQILYNTTICCLLYVVLYFYIKKGRWCIFPLRLFSIRGFAVLKTLSSAQCSCFKPIRFDRRLKIRREAGCFGLISCWRSADAPRSVKHIPFSLRPTVHKTDSQFRPSYRWCRW